MSPSTVSLYKSARTAIGSLLMAGLLVATTACATAAPRGRVYVRTGPPTPIVETRIGAPGPGFVWVPGYYRWDGRAYAWAPGRWDRPPRARARWEPAHWQRDRRGWYFVEGRWR
jgi:hypothetical protein